VIAATGKVTDRKPTATRRAADGLDRAAVARRPRAPAGCVQRDDDHRRRRPHGRLSLDDFLADRRCARTDGHGCAGQDRAAQGIAATVDNAAGFRCVAPPADPASLSLAKRASGDFTVTERGLDDQRALPSSSNIRIS
jgi:hypothetical protein